MGALQDFGCLRGESLQSVYPGATSTRRDALSRGVDCLEIMVEKKKRRTVLRTQNHTSNSTMCSITGFGIDYCCTATMARSSTLMLSGHLGSRIAASSRRNILDVNDAPCFLMLSRRKGEKILAHCACIVSRSHQTYVAFRGSQASWLGEHSTQISKAACEPLKKDISK